MNLGPKPETHVEGNGRAGTDRSNLVQVSLGFRASGQELGVYKAYSPQEV